MAGAVSERKCTVVGLMVAATSMNRRLNVPGGSDTWRTSRTSARLEL